MRQLFICIFSLVSILGSFAQTSKLPERYFPYPEPPENLTTLEERTSYLVEHFWERCNFKSAFSSQTKFAQAFDDYISFMPYADGRVVHESIDRLIKEVKKNPKNMLTLARLAESRLYDGESDYTSDELYLPFARAAVASKGIPAADRKHFEEHISALEHTIVGAPIADLTLTLPDGSRRQLSEMTGHYTLLFIDRPGDMDNLLARTRLSADTSINELIADGYLQVIILTPSAPDDAWRASVADYPSNWTVAASPEAATNLDMRYVPTIYYLNRDNLILSKTLETENLLGAFHVVLSNRKAKNAASSTQQQTQQE